MSPPSSLSILASLHILCLLLPNMLLYRECGSPARATLIVDWSGRLRYMAAHRTDITRLGFVNIIDLVVITIINTRPKPPCGRQGLAG